MLRTVEPEVEIRTSGRRRKTATAFWQDGRVVVVVPSRMPVSSRHEMVELLVGRALAQRPNLASSDSELARRCAELGDRYLSGIRPTSVRWVTNQRSRWGSCTNLTGEIRISERLRSVPNWVLDSVLLHELAHLVEPGHSDRFRSLIDRYPRLAEADAFLAGYALGLDCGAGRDVDQLEAAGGSW
jgi:predicted metal-dependent hydrolase